MASSSSSSLLIILASVLCLASVCRADLISDVCAKSTNPAFCTLTLRSDPRARSADILGLGRFVVEKSIAATQNVVTVAKSIAGEPAGTCVETSGEAIDELNECAAYLKSFAGDISDLQTHGSAALTDVSTCDDEFGSRQPANLKAASKKAQDLIDVLLVIANKL